MQAVKRTWTGWREMPAKGAKVRGPFWNARRLRDYPRLFFTAMWTLLLLNVIFRNGWLGATGQLIGTDFIMLYSGGALAGRDASQLYNFARQEKTQRELVHLTE
jgi:hypothetical protein